MSTRTDPTTRTNLTTWEQAEIQRSRVQARRSTAARRTPPSVVARYTDPPEGTPYALEYAYHLLGDLRGLTVLDYGCGDGPNTTLLAVRGAEVYALDLSADLLDLAAGRLRADGREGRTTLLCGSGHAVPLADNSVDVVFGDSILHHLDLELARAEVLRVLRPGGRAIFKEPVRESRLLRAVRPLIPYRKADVSPYERPLSNSEIERFSEPFTRGRSRRFRLPLVAVADALGTAKRVRQQMYALDRQLLAKHRWLRTYASLIVFELIKPGLHDGPHARD